MTKKIVIITFSFVILLIILFVFWIFLTGPSLPMKTDEIINKVISSELPEQIKGEPGYAENSGIKIWYESIKPGGNIKGNILLIMGISNDALAWPDYFIDSLLQEGYRIIRFDNRGTGMSDWIHDWKNNKYDLKDMATDCISIIDKLGIQKIHVVAVSLGGMVGQELAIQYPERILSLTSLMSSGYITDPESPKMNMATVIQLVKVSLKYGFSKSESNAIKVHIAARTILRNKELTLDDVKNIAEKVLYNIRKRKGYNPESSPQHQSAVMLSGSRYEELKKIKIPTVIIHGKSDPLIDVEHGIKCSELIPDAKTLFIDGMGHDISFKYNQMIINSILDNIRGLK